MENSFYQEIFEDGRAEGMAQAIIQLLAFKLGHLDPAVTSRVKREKDATVLNAWLMDIGQAADAEAAARVLRKIAAA